MLDLDQCCAVGARIPYIEMTNNLKFGFPMAYKQDGSHFINHWKTEQTHVVRFST